MKFTDGKALWEKWLENNQDEYGAAIYAYAKSWAELMEKEMPEDCSDVDKFLRENASTLSHKADVEGITGFMYGAAVSILASTWIHGEALRRWHNLDTQIQDEGEEANAKGVTLNPALLSIEVPDK